LPGNLCNTAKSAICPGCDRPIHADVFPALFRDQQPGRSAEAILEAGVSSCFYHEGKKAVVPCDGCGRFLCALCDVELNNQHLCPSCFDNSRTKGTLVNLEAKRFVYDSAALSLAVLPLLIWPVTIITSPLAVGFGIFSFFRPGSLVGRKYVRGILAVVIGLGQMAGWLMIFVS